MPRYFFNLDDSRPIEDHTGEHVRDLEHAKVIAKKIIDEFVLTKIAQQMPAHWHIVVTDEEGAVVHVAYPNLH